MVSTDRESISTNIQTNTTLLLNVETGNPTVLNSSGFGFYIGNFAVATNLTAGDLVYTGGVATFNETIVSSYLGPQLETNHWIYEVNQINYNLYGYVVNHTMTSNFYYDRGTGVLVDAHRIDDYSRSNGTDGVLTAHADYQILILLATPPPIFIPEFSPALALPLLMLTTLAASGILQEKSAKLSKAGNRRRWLG